MHRVTITGVSGSLKWHYHEAATVTAWTVTREGNTWTLTASIVRTDAFRVSQRPLVFVAPHAKGAWRWPVTELQMSGASLSAVLGPPEN